MPGWIIQGVRGEGKSLAAIGKIKEYMQRGCPVATNLDLYLENLLPDDNQTIAYRLPDHPRLEDFELLPPAYDVSYKGEDKNGLLVLDELGTWMNSRSWNDKTRLKLLNWLFLSRKYHWDLVLLAQDFEMIDSQVRTTCCDYLVQSSRLDRQKIPYLGSLLEFLGFNAFMPKVHVYHVFYGMSTNQKAVTKWQFTGKDLYDAYDTNQRFRDGHEPILGTLIDMRAVYSYIPANYLTKHVHVSRLLAKIEHIKKLTLGQGLDTVAIKRTTSDETKLKAIILSVLFIGFVAWRFLFSGFDVKPKNSSASVTVPVPVNSPAPSNSSILTAAVASVAPVQAVAAPVPVDVVASVAPVADSFMSTLFQKYRPRLSSFVYSEEEGFFGFINFFDGSTLVERFNIKELHSLGVSVVRRPYGVDLVHAGQTYIVSSWNLSKSESVQSASVTVAKNP